MLEENATILVVDDDLTNVELLNDILQSRYRVLFALNGDDAVTTAQEQNPDLILLDIVMEGRDGYDTCKALKSLPETSDIPIIFVTALDGIEDEEKGLALGAVDYIAKPFSPAIVRLRVANHIELKRQRDILYSLSQLDGLTSIANRRAFDNTLEQFWHAQIRRELPVTIIMIDIDHFKRFNDTRGHAVGDEVLRRVASALVQCVKRGQDMVARIGGEEFAALLPDTDIAGASEIASAMLESVNALDIPHPDSPTGTHLTVSIGVSGCIPTRGSDPRSLLVRADDALYQSKREGRARYCALSLEL